MPSYIHSRKRTFHTTPSSVTPGSSAYINASFAMFRQQSHVVWYKCQTSGRPCVFQRDSRNSKLTMLPGAQLHQENPRSGTVETRMVEV